MAPLVSALVDVVIALHGAAAVLLLLAGLAKLVRPQPATELLETLGFPARTPMALAIGATEIGVGAGALAVGGAGFAVATGALYIGFGLVVIRALMVGAESCGCFGRADAPPSLIHVVGNTAFAAISFWAASADKSAVDVMNSQPAAGLPFVLVIGVLAGLALVAFTALPEALSARKPGSGGAQTFQIDTAAARQVKSP